MRALSGARFPQMRKSCTLQAPRGQGLKLGRLQLPPLNKMAMGILRIAPIPNTWTQLPDQAANSVTFQKSDYEIAFSETPGANTFSIRNTDPPFTLTLDGNLNCLWIRSFAPVVLLWRNP
jgi:hypothetical protein